MADGGASSELGWSRAAPNGWPVWGHDAAVDGLRRAIAGKRVRHAYLFSGPVCVGKATLAQAFAQALNCLDAPAEGLACGGCLACRKIARGVHPDVQTFSLETQAATAEKQGSKNTSLSVETVRALGATTVLRPMEGRWQVVIVEDAETLQGVAQEALLKTLEEPPPFVVLLMLADDAELLLPTIRSRCELVELRVVNRAVVAGMLRAAGAAPGREDEIASLAGGRPGWALRAAHDARLLRRQAEAVERAFDWIAGSAYDRLVTAARLGDAFSKRRQDVFADLETTLGIWRDVLLLSAAQLTYLTYRGNAERLSELARGWHVADIQRAASAVRRGIEDLETNVRPRLALENMVLQWPTAQGPR